MLNYEHCELCPRRCGANRAAGQKGFCGQTAGLRAARAAAHYWEEPVISGDFGSGAVFFSGCTLACKFCQNEEISHGGFGYEITPERLRDIFENLIDQGVSNINLVTGTQFLPTILPALTPKLPVPVVWNSGGYESVETLRAMEGLVDVYLPDFKFYTPLLAKTLCGAGDYPKTAMAAIQEMYRQTGPAVYDDSGLMVRGTLVRHLLLPGQVKNALSIIDWVHETFPEGAVPFSLMRQYFPAGKLANTPPFDRPVTDEEYEGALSWLYLNDMDAGFTQEAAASDGCFVPEWNGEGILTNP